MHGKLSFSTSLTRNKRTTNDLGKHLDAINNTKHFFVPNQEPAFSLLFGNGPVRVGTQGLFRPCLKTFIPPFLPTRLTAPGSRRMGWSKPLKCIFAIFLMEQSCAMLISKVESHASERCSYNTG